VPSKSLRQTGHPREGASSFSARPASPPRVNSQPPFPKGKRKHELDVGREEKLGGSSDSCLTLLRVMRKVKKIGIMIGWHSLMAKSLPMFDAASLLPGFT
jgi:hypothetical protein